MAPGRGRFSNHAQTVYGFAGFVYVEFDAGQDIVVRASTQMHLYKCISIRAKGHQCIAPRAISLIILCHLCMRIGESRVSKIAPEYSRH